MSERLSQSTKWLWFLLALYSGPSLSPVRCVAVKTPPKTPSTIEAQAKFFQDFFSVQLSPYKIEFGHVCEDPNNWEQRYERKDYKNHRDMGKVRWGDKKGGYGEHYWDLNHAGHAGNHGNDDYHGHNSDHDDGSYHENDTPSSNYDGPSDHSYGTDEYDPEKSSYEETGRAKRAHPRTKTERTVKHTYHDRDEEPRPKSRKVKEQVEETASQEEDDYSNDKEIEEEEEKERVYKKSKRPHHRQQQQQQQQQQQLQQKQEDDDISDTKEAKKQVVVVKEIENPEPTTYTLPTVPTRQVDYTKYVPYEGGAGVRQHHHVTAVAPVPRLFLEPSTGHVVDRATGQAYVLQPIAALNYS